MEIKQENIRIKHFFTKALAEKWSGKEFPFSPVTGKRAEIGMVMSDSPGVKLSLFDDSGDLVAVETCSAHPMTIANFEKKMMKTIADAGEDCVPDRNRIASAIDLGSLLPIDVGFDLRKTKSRIDIPSDKKDEMKIRVPNKKYSKGTLLVGKPERLVAMLKERGFMAKVI